MGSDNYANCNNLWQVIQIIVTATKDVFFSPLILKDNWILKNSKNNNIQFRLYFSDLWFIARKITIIIRAVLGAFSPLISGLKAKQTNLQTERFFFSPHGPGRGDWCKTTLCSWFPANAWVALYGTIADNRAVQTWHRPCPPLWCHSAN